MALPQPVFEQLTHRPAQSQGWSGQILMFTATVLVVVLLLYLGVHFGYRPYIEGRVASLDQRIQDFSKQISQEEQNRALAFYGKLANIKRLLDDHTVPSAIFEWIEQNTLPTVFYNRLSVSTNNRQIVLSVSAKDMTDVTRQLEHFQTAAEVERAIFANAGETNGVWQFELTLTMKPNFFKPY